MNKNKNKVEKSTQEYRRDIFTLKKKLKEEEQNLQEMKQKYQNADVLADTSYTYSMKLKILEYTLNDIRAKTAKFSKEEQFEYYLLNFATFALLKSCEVVGITKEMIFRGVDVEAKGQVGYFQFSTFLRQVMRLDSQFINPLMKVLCPDESKPIKKQRYEQFLAVFMIQNEQNGDQSDYLENSINRVAKELDRQHVEPKKIWTIKEINIAISVHGLINSCKNLDVLDCVACYCRCDPLKAGTINSSALVNLLQHRIDDGNNFQAGAVKFKLQKIDIF